MDTIKKGNLVVFLSVIIPTRNRGKELSVVLKSITKQILQPELFEVIVVDNGSTDNTKEIVQAFNSKILNLRYFYDSTPGLHIGRHKGLAEAKAEILVYVDDDIRAFPTWLEGIMEAFDDEDAVLVGGKNIPDYESEPPVWINAFKNETEFGWMIGYLSLLDFGNAPKEIPGKFVFGCNFSIRKDVLFECGGFHPDGLPEELIQYRGDGETYVSQFISHKGYKTIYHPKASVYHCVPSERMTEHYLFRRFYAQGISDSYTQIRSGSLKHHWVTLALKTIKRLPLFCTNRLHARAFKSYIEGYYFHRREVCKNAELYEWVKHKNYLE